MYEVLVSHEADKNNKKQDSDTKRRINKCVEIQPRAAFRTTYPKLHGQLEGKHRYEVGGIRIVATRLIRKAKLLK